jgi:hypothetical protein
MPTMIVSPSLRPSPETSVKAPSVRPVRTATARGAPPASSTNKRPRLDWRPAISAMISAYFFF